MQYRRGRLLWSGKTSFQKRPMKLHKDDPRAKVTDVPRMIKVFGFCTPCRKYLSGGPTVKPRLTWSLLSAGATLVILDETSTRALRNIPSTLFSQRMINAWNKFPELEHVLTVQESKACLDGACPKLFLNLT